MDCASPCRQSVQHLTSSKDKISSESVERLDREVAREMSISSSASTLTVVLEVKQHDTVPCFLRSYTRLTVRGFHSTTPVLC